MKIRVLKQCVCKGEVLYVADSKKKRTGVYDVDDIDGRLLVNLKKAERAGKEATKSDESD